MCAGEVEVEEELRTRQTGKYIKEAAGGEDWAWPSAGGERLATRWEGLESQKDQDLKKLTTHFQNNMACICNKSSL